MTITIKQKSERQCLVELYEAGKKNALQPFKSDAYDYFNLKMRYLCAVFLSLHSIPVASLLYCI
jgi:hypothetical protein